mmetsp:Transcript_33131/g.80061  ORF Transcript_33131/g.80061 Transcript_33131/m.80061 type:complete len:566 (+) Transcript_33131:162-1859(+)
MDTIDTTTKRSKTRQKRSREDSSFQYSSPSTFVSSEFQIGTMNSKAESHQENAPPLNQERGLWNQVLNIRQIVSLMQDNLNQLTATGGSLTAAGNGNQDVNSIFDLSKELSLEEDDDSWDSADEIINLEGILVHVSSSSEDAGSSSQQLQQQQQQYHHYPDDASEAASSCVSSLGLGGHETTTPMHLSSSIARGNLVSPGYSESAAPTAAPTTTAAEQSSSRSLQRQQGTDDESLSSVESFTTWQEFLHFFRILYYFLLEFPIHFYKSLTDSIPNTNASKTPRSRNSSSSKRETRRFLLYVLLTLFIIGSVVWKQCPSCFPTSTPLPRLGVSQSCVTPIITKNATHDLSPPLLSVTMKSKRPRRNASYSSSAISLLKNPTRATFEIMDTPLPLDDDMRVSKPTQDRVIDLEEEEEEESKVEEESSSQEEEIIARPKNIIVHQLKNQGKKLVQKLAKNNHKMWDHFPTPVSTTSTPKLETTTTSSEKKQIPAPLQSLQEKGQEVLGKLVKNNHKMWDNYPTTTVGGMPSSLSNNNKQGNTQFKSFLQKTANMWSPKRSDYLVNNDS